MIFKTKRDLIQRLIHPVDVVLDIGFSGQGIRDDDPNWPHRIIKEIAAETYGVDIDLPDSYKGKNYLEASAEYFSLPVQFDVIFAGDLIEHLSNPGLFLDGCRAHLKTGGRLILTTPNTFNLFNLVEKLTKNEPTVNPDHTFYFNRKTLEKLLEKNAWRVTSVDFLYTLGYKHKESWRKKILNLLNKIISFWTEKFSETLVITATPE